MAPSASADLFDGATWFLSPLAQTDPEHYRLVHGFVGDLGATPVAVDPGAHDRLVALTSHLPHVIANVLVNQPARPDDPCVGRWIAAGHDPRGRRQPADLGRHLPRERRRASGRARRAPARPRAGGAALESGDAGFLARWIGEAALNRRRMISEAYSDPGSCTGCASPGPARCARGDHPGARRRADQHRGLRGSSTFRRSAALTVLVSGAEEAERAAALLEAQGYGVVVSPAVEE